MARAKSKGTSSFDGGAMKMKLATTTNRWEDKPYKGFFQPTMLRSGAGEGLIGFQTSREFTPGETWDSEKVDLGEVVEAMLHLAEAHKTQVYDRAVRGLEHFGPKCELALKCKLFKSGSVWKPVPYVQISPAPVEIKAPAKVKVKAPASTALKIPALKR